MSRQIFLFGMPAYQTNIDPTSFNKKDIIKTIASNYKKNPRRGSKEYGNMHHLVKDWTNADFKLINTDELIPIYKKYIEDFFSLYSNNFQFMFEIINYTCYGKYQFMRRHGHGHCDFVGIHYIKIEEEHSPTIFHNPNSTIDFLIDDDCKRTYQSLFNKMDKFGNSWFYPRFAFNIREDDFIITHGSLEHEVEPGESESLRMAIVVNISITDGMNKNRKNSAY